MARQPRIHIDGGYYHVMLRGNGGDEIFSNDADRYHFFMLLQEGVKRFEHRIHAFCLMSNHVHLVIEVGNIPLSKIMQNLSFRYTRWFNNHQKRTGHLFQGRFKALLIDEDHYLLELVRYTHLNPVRAGMVKSPSAYSWSSHLAYTGEQTVPWLTSDTVLSHFSSHLDAARKSYASFVMDGLSESHRAEFHTGGKDRRVLGNDRFAEQVLEHSLNTRRTLTLDECLAHVCKVYELETSALSERTRVRKHSEARAVVAWLMGKFSEESLTMMATYFHRDVATMSTAVRKLEKRLITDSEFKKKIDLIHDNIKL
ncbi:MAG: transposase [Mariprofundaceae bacterium]|nr:transposase [Mariprofundaceae bacterium]